MFKKVNVPILGLVSNMSLFTCPDCGSQHRVFGDGDGVQRVCADHGIPFLGDVPLHPSIGGSAQEGRPTVVAEPGGERAETFMRIARDVAGRIGL